MLQQPLSDIRKKIIIEQNFHLEYLLLGLNLNIFYNNIVPKSKVLNIFSQYINTVKNPKQLNIKFLIFNGGFCPTRIFLLKRPQWCGGIDFSWAKAAINWSQEMEKHKEFLKQKFCILKEALQETKTNNQVSSEALISLELEVMTNCTLNIQVTMNTCMEKQVTENLKLWERTQWIRHQSKWQVPGQPKVPEIESNAKFPHPAQTGFKNINTDIMEYLVVMENFLSCWCTWKSCFVVLYCQEFIWTTLVVWKSWRKQYKWY